MKNRASVKSISDAQSERPGSCVEKALLASRWEWEHWRDGKMVDSWTERNLCTNQGLNYLLGAGFSATTAITAWYVAVYDNNHTRPAATPMPFRGSQRRPTTARLPGRHEPRRGSVRSRSPTRPIRRALLSRARRRSTARPLSAAVARLPRRATRLAAGRSTISRRSRPDQSRWRAQMCSRSLSPLAFRMFNP